LPASGLKLHRLVVPYRFVSSVHDTNSLQSVKSRNLRLSIVENALNEAPIFIFIGFPKKASPSFYRFGSQTPISGAADDVVFTYRSYKQYPISSQHLGTSVIAVSYGNGSVDASLDTIREPTQ
jgi:hypothetical protein